MKTKMTFKQYIDNPMGKGSALFSGRDMYRKTYQEKFDKLMLREAGNLTYYLFYDKTKDNYYCYIKMASESVENFYYDIVIKFFTDNPDNKGKQDLKDYYVQFYSDDPAFIYTYMHVFMEKDLFVEELKSKIPKEVIKKDTHTRNPNSTVGYVKSIYFSYLYMNLKNLFTKYMYNTYGEPFNKQKFLKIIDDLDKKLNSRQAIEAENKKKKQLEKKREAQQKKDNTQEDESLIASRNKVKNISVVKSVNRIGSSNKVNSIKKVKKI